MKPYEFRAFRSRFDADRMPSMIAHSPQAPDAVATFAMECIEKWGLVAAMPDGEDSAGRAKLRVCTAQELTSRAFDLAEAAYAEAEKRGLMLNYGSLAEIDELAKANEDKN